MIQKIDCGYVIEDLHTLSDGIALLRRVERFGRVSHDAEERQTEDSWQRFIKTWVVDRGDWSIAEHASVSVKMRMDIGIGRELTRHRIGAYTQESTRFVNYKKSVLGMQFLEPPFKFGKSVSVWETCMEVCEHSYKQLLEIGEAPELARSVLPLGLKTSIVVTYNLRNWRHFFLMRTTREVHPQMKELVIPLLSDFQRLIPLLYDDIIPDEPQAVAVAKRR